MATLPYVTSPGNIDKTLNGIKSAAVPERVSQDFVKTILKIPGGSGDQMTAFLKKIGFTNQDGTPSDTYKKFRNPSQSQQAIAKAIRHAYAPLYIRNEFMHELNDEQLLGLITEETGLPHDANQVKLAFACIKHLKAFAEFSEVIEHTPTPNIPMETIEHSQKSSYSPKIETEPSQSIGLNLGYTINLNLPATSDPEVFNAIFKSLKEHLLSSSDA